MAGIHDKRARFGSLRVEEMFHQVSELIDRSVLPLEANLENEPFREDGQMAVDRSIEELRRIARSSGLWNFFMTYSGDGPGLSNVEYAHFAEKMGTSLLAAEVFNCDAPDSGNMEILDSFGKTPYLRHQFERLSAGECRSAFAMTERDSAGSYPRGLEAELVDGPKSLTLNGCKWFVSGLLFPQCESILVFARDKGGNIAGKSYSIVAIPRHAPGVNVRRSMPIFGFPSRGGHCEVEFNDVKVERDWVLGELGSGFDIAQSRLGPGRIHHAMRCIGMAERALGLLVERAATRRVSGGMLIEKGVIRHWIGESRIQIDQTRELVLATASAMDSGDTGRARQLTSMIKVAAPRMATYVIDRAIQVHGSHGLTEDFPLARMWARARSLQFGDGPDEVHLEVVARQEIQRSVGQSHG